MDERGLVFWLLRAGRITPSLLFVLLLIPPGSANASPSADSATVDGTYLTISFSEEFATSSSVVASDFTVELGQDEQTVSLATVSGTNVSLILTTSIPDPDCTDEDVSVGFTPVGSSLIGVNGGAVAAFSDLHVANLTDAAPQVVSLSTNANGRAIYVMFCENITDISYQWSDFSAFSITVNDNARPVNDLIRRSDSPNRLELQLGRSKAIEEGDVVTLAYDQSKGDENYPLQDSDQGGKLVASWTARSVTNHVDGPPTLTSMSALYEHITLTFSESLDEESVPEPDAFLLNGPPHTPGVAAVSVSDATVTLTLEGILHNQNAPTYSLSYYEPSLSPLRQADGAHNVADIYSHSFTSDTPDTRPVITEATVDGAELTLTFDLPLNAVAPASAFTISGTQNISISETMFADTQVTLTLSSPVPAGATITLSYVVPNSTPRLTGRNHRDVDAFANQTVTNKTAIPAPVVNAASVSADEATLTLTFSLALKESMVGTPPTSAFTLSGTDAEVDSLTITGTVVTLFLRPPADFGETITLDYQPPSDASEPRLQSAAHAKAVAAFSDQTVTNNADGKPRPLRATIDGAALTIIFDRTLDDQSVPSASSFALSGVSVSISTISISSTTLTLTIDPTATHVDTITVAYTQPDSAPLKRGEGTQLVDSFSGLVVTNLTADPTPKFVSASVDASGAELTVVMSGSLRESADGLPDTSVFAITGTTQAEVISVSIDGSNVILGLNPLADLMEIFRLSYQPPTNPTDPSLRSADGRWQTAAWSDAVVANQADGVPRLQTISGNTSSIVLKFDRTLDAQATPTPTDFTMTPTSRTVSGVAIHQETVTLTLSQPLEYNDLVTVSYSASGSTKLRRSQPAIDIPAFSAVSVDNHTPRPLIRTIIGDDRNILVTLSEALDTTSIPDPTAFALTPSHSTITAITVDTYTISLSLGSSLREGVAYNLAYTTPTVTPLMLADRTLVPGFSAPMTNNTDFAATALSATGDGMTITVTFDQDLDKDVALDADTFSITASPVVDVSSVTYGDSSVVVTLSRALREDEVTSLTYTQPEQGGLTDLSGLRTASFTLDIDNITDTPPVPVSAHVAGNTITIILDQDLYADPRFDGEDGYPTEHFTLTGTDATIDFVYVSNGGDRGVGKIEITLSRKIEEGDQLSITYFPSSGSIRIRDDDPGQNRAEINAYSVSNLTDQPPIPESASVNGTTLRISFDQVLDSQSLPTTSAFALSDDGPTVDSVAISDAQVTLTLSSTAIEDASYTVTYTPPTSGALRDLTGNDVAAFTVTVENATDYAPFPVRIATDSSGTVVFLRYDQRLDPSVTLDPSWFSVVPTIDLHSVIIDPNVSGGTQLRLILDSTIRIQEGATVTLQYGAPPSGGLRDDDAGNRVESFSKQVLNVVDVAPVVSSITVNRATVDVRFDQDLDPNHVPPPNCEYVEVDTEGFECDDHPDISWFTVLKQIGQRTEHLGVGSVVIAGSQVILSLAEPVTPDDTIRVKYSPESLQGGRWNLRDRSTPSHQVESFDAIKADNITPASAIGASFDRSAANQIYIEFDGALSDMSTIDPNSISVMIEGNEVSVLRADVSDRTLTSTLARAVPECSSISIVHTDRNPRLLDARGRTIDSFGFDVANLIDPAWSLQCVHTDFGGVVLTFADSVPERSTFDWELNADGEARDVSVHTDQQVVRVVPTPSICGGDSVEVKYSGKDELDSFSVTRTFSDAAPCAISASADATLLTVTFDSDLGSTLPEASDFTINGGAAVEAVSSISGTELRIRLVSPGLRAGQAHTLRYVGNSLRGSGLTVGPFAIDVEDRTAPPELESAFAVGDSLFLKFDQPLLVRSVPGSRFTLAGPEIDQRVESVSISGRSAYLKLSKPLPDDPDLFALVYLAGSRGGLAGLTGARVRDSVFVVQNYTETQPSVLSVVADSTSLVVDFDQRIVGSKAQPIDFSVVAGHRAIDVTSLDWSRTSLTITLSERITSLDAVALRYEPQDGGAVRDLSGISLRDFEIWAENETSTPRTMSGRIADARLRATSGETTLARELVREFAVRDRIHVVATGGDGWTRIAWGGVTVSIDAGSLGDHAVHLSVAPIDRPATILAELESVPRSCWEPTRSTSVSAWWIGVSDARAIPSDVGVQLTVDGAFAGVPTSEICTLDLTTGEWSRFPPSGLLSGPTLLLRSEGAPRASLPW